MKRYDQFALEDKNKIIQAYDSGMYIKDICNVLSLSKRGVSRVVNEAGYNTNRKNRYTLEESYFENVDNEKKAYILGLLLADGYVDKRNYIVIQLKDGDREIIEDIAKEIKFTGEIKYYPPQKNRYSDKGFHRLAFSSEKMAHDLMNHGMCEHKSLGLKSLPNISSHLVRHMIRGYFDGDGSVIVPCRTTQKYEPSPTFSILATDEVAREIRKTLVDGCKCTQGYLKQSKTPGLSYIEIRGNKNLLKIYRYLYDDATIYLKRKHDKFRTIRPLREETLDRKSG